MSFCANLERDLPSLATIVSEKTDLRQRDEILEDQDLELFRRSLRNREQLCHQWGRPMTTLDIQEIEFQFRECVGNRYAYSEQISSVEKYHQEFCEWKRWMGILYGWEDPEEVVVSIFIRGLKESIRSKMSSPLASSLNCAYLEAIAIELSMRRMDPCLEKKSYGVDPNPLQDDANRDLEWQMLSANVKEKEPEDGRSLENDVSAVQNHVSVVNCISTVEVNKSLRMIDGFYEIDWDEKEVVAELVALSLDAKLLAVNDLYLVVENESKGHRFGSHGKELWNVAYDNFQKAIVEVDYTNGWQLCNDTKHMFLGKLLVHDPGGQCCFNSRLRSRHLNSFEDPCFDTVSEVLKFSIATICNDLGWQDEHTDDMVYDPGGISIHKHEKSLMGGGDKSLANHNSLQRVKVYRLNDDGKWDDQGTGHVTIDYMERSECLFVTDGETDVKVYTVGPEYAHADARKSRGVDGVVMTNFNGKEVRYLVLLEFAGTEDMIQSGEKLFGDYDWGRFDLLVLPPSFPYGRMENPRMVFLTPTVLKGDASGAQVVAHELAHSWTGNLITNKNNEHFWLNEGFTTYAERRIVEAVQGNDIADLNIGIGWRGLNEEMERFKYSMEFTKLKLSEEGVDPDDIYSQVPYEKGFQFLWRIERQVGRPAIEEFLKKYIANFKFQQIDTVTFLDFLKANVPSIENEIDLKLWTEGTGIPPDAYEPVSNIYTKILSLANDFKLGRIPEEGEVADRKGQEWELYLENLPKSVEPSQISTLDARYRLSESTDYEVKLAFLQLAISSQCKDDYSEVEKTLKEVGRIRKTSRGTIPNFKP